MPAPTASPAATPNKADAVAKYIKERGGNTVIRKARLLSFWETGRGPGGNCLPACLAGWLALTDDPISCPIYTLCTGAHR